MRSSIAEVAQGIEDRCFSPTGCDINPRAPFRILSRTPTTASLLGAGQSLDTRSIVSLVSETCRGRYQYRCQVEPR
jgi:hypothetical protein